MDDVIFRSGPQSGLMGGQGGLNDTQYQKFHRYPFHLLVRFENENGEWAEIYEVEW